MKLKEFFDILKRCNGDFGKFLEHCKALNPNIRFKYDNNHKFQEYIEAGYDVRTYDKSDKVNGMEDFIVTEISFSIIQDINEYDAYVNRVSFSLDGFFIFYVKDFVDLLKNSEGKFSLVFNELQKFPHVIIQFQDDCSADNAKDIVLPIPNLEDFSEEVKNEPVKAVVFKKNEEGMIYFDLILGL